MKKITFLLVIAFSFMINGKCFSQNNYIGEIKLVPYNFAPLGWLKCEGQLLPIAQNQTLFSLLGTTYGGNGQTTFALPDLRGRVAMHSGQGLGLSNYALGQTGGTETNTLTVSQMPAHNHTINANTADGNQNDPAGGYPANTKLLDKEYSNAAPNTTMNPAMVGIAGNSQPVNNVQPYLTLTYIIATTGIFPPQN